jgi:hypothetical protein
LSCNFKFLQIFQAQEPRQGPSISKETTMESIVFHHIKWIIWNNVLTPIITQDGNGPCPMLAITNVLLLRGKITLPKGSEGISSQQLLQKLGIVCLFITVHR